MKKMVKLLDYDNNKKTFWIKDFEKVILLYFEIKSGDGILHVIYPNKILYLDSSSDRCIDYHDFSVFLLPKYIKLINKMKKHDDIEELMEAEIVYEY